MAIKKIFCEAHNSNMSTGFGQFNYHFLKALYSIKYKTAKIVVHTSTIAKFKEEFINFFKYKYYLGLFRYKPFRISKKYDLWHSLNQNTKIIPKYNIPMLLTIHDVNFMEVANDTKRIKRLRALFEEKLDRANTIVYISEYSKRQTHKYFRIRDKTETIIYNGCTILEKDKKLINPSPTASPFFFSIGNFLERKNFLSIVKMMHHFQDKNLFIAGNCSTSYGKIISSYIIENDLKNVHLLGIVSDYHKQCYLEYCEVFLFPSISEGFGLPLLEAMKFSKPIVSSSKTCLPEILGDAGYYFKDFEPLSMSNTVKFAIVDFKTNKDKKLLNMKKKLELFSWEKAAKQYAELYDTLLNDNKR